MRTIDTDALRDFIGNRYDITWEDDPYEVGIKDACTDILEFVNSQPIIDAVHVVRCEDCKFVGTDATCCLVCNREGMGLRPFHVYHDDYCSYAERKEE